MSHVIRCILITGANLQEHLSNLEEVLKRLLEHGVRLHMDKCVPSVEYLSHVIDGDGLHTADNKLKAIVKAPSPKNVQELRSFLGHINYCGKFIPTNCCASRPSEPGPRSVRTSSDVLKKPWYRVPVHYNPSLPLRLAEDAFAYGVGAVISHVMEDDSEHPIAYASRSSKRNYAPVEKEASLSGVWCKKIPLLFVRQEVYAGDRPQAPHYHPGSQEQGSTLSY